MSETLSWFVSEMKEKMLEWNNCMIESKKLTQLISTSKNELKKTYTKLYRKNYFQMIRQSTDLYNFADQYLPTIHKQYSMQKLMTVMYKKVYDCYANIHDTKTKPKTDEERKTVKMLIDALQNFEKNIVVIIPDSKSLKLRNR